MSAALCIAALLLALAYAALAVLGSGVSDLLLELTPLTGLVLWGAHAAQRERGLAVLWLAGLLLYLPLRLYGASPALYALPPAVPVIFWLMHRFSNIAPGWTLHGARVVTGLVLVAGVFISLDLPLREVVVPLVFIIFGAHSYRAFSDRNSNRTLSAQWVALAIVLLLFSVAFSLFAPLAEVRDDLLRWALLALTLGLVNQVMAELRGENRRVTGLLPFWCVVGGLLGQMLAAGGMALVRHYTVDVFALDPMAVEMALRPVQQGVQAAQVAVLAGMAIYALGFLARRL